MKLEKVKKTYNGTKAIEDISFSVKNGEFIAIVGPSGCGKTTLLKLCAGLIEPTEGKIKKEKASVVFQKPILLPWKTVEDNVTLPLRISKKKGSPDKLLETVDLIDFKNNYPGELSGGMQQRVALARALITEPQVLLMDEPFGALDEFLREKMNLDILNIWRKYQTTIIFVTHSIQEAIFLADKVIVLSKRPSKIKEIIPIKLKRPRKLEIKTTPEFQRYVKWIQEKLQS